ncbi:hypothetical protein OS493_005487 [Desmophyllum pertusum]|uniref:Uncharacterized protein n=1 Tax=Desmophyllum pertusum TaxID=174260 RepID=A0A9W9YSD5_9CNID|nr:hypothetical protein OS493_005487 [Desmophyllum pertusum]
MADVSDFEWEFGRFKASYCLMFTLSFLLYSTGVKPVLLMAAHCLLVYCVLFHFQVDHCVWICCLGIVLSLANQRS